MSLFPHHARACRYASVLSLQTCVGRLQYSIPVHRCLQLANQDVFVSIELHPLPQFLQLVAVEVFNIVIDIRLFKRHQSKSAGRNASCKETVRRTWAVMDGSFLGHVKHLEGGVRKGVQRPRIPGKAACSIQKVQPLTMYATYHATNAEEYWFPVLTGVFADILFLEGTEPSNFFFLCP